MSDMATQYEAIRSGVGARVVGRDVLLLAGADAAGFLQGQCSQDVEGMAVGGHADALLLSPQGKLDALIRVTRLDECRFVIDTDEGYGDLCAQRLNRFKLRVKVEIEPLAYRCVMLRGPRSGEVATNAELVIPFSWGGVTGVDMLGPALEIPPGATACEPAAWEAVRVEAGIPVMGSELDDRTIAAEAGLLERCVSFTKGCYTGQELVARLDSRGNKVSRHLRGLVGEEPFIAGSELASMTTGKVVGSVTSAANSPHLGPVALGYVHRGVEIGAQVELRREDGQRQRATVRELPLLDAVEA